MLRPGATIGILGGGQLGRMLTLAAARLGFKCHIYAPEGDNPAFDVAYASTAAGYDDEAALASFAEAVDVVTYEFENVPLTTADFVAARCRLCPPALALEVSQHRVREKQFFNDLGIATADWFAITSLEDLKAQAAERLDNGDWGIIKTCRLGYDGKGQARIKSHDDLKIAWSAYDGQELIFERAVPFTREVSVIAARGHDGTTAVFDIVENVHENGILRSSVVPAAISSKTVAAAHEIAEKTLKALDYVGVLTIELFAVENGNETRLLVNEFAPRVHNSGHWTEAACAVSQFEQHIRAIAGWPLGSAGRHSNAVMSNLLGEEILEAAKLASEPDTIVHVYGKAAAKPGRKMGHVTRISPKI